MRNGVTNDFELWQGYEQRYLIAEVELDFKVFINNLAFHLQTSFRRSRGTRSSADCYVTSMLCVKPTRITL